MKNVDIVVPWVDGTDSKWQMKKKTYTGDKINDADEYDGVKRYRDYGILKYLFRSIEMNAKWVNHVFLVTDGQKPDWLDETYEKVSVVDHTDFIDSKYLPTFNTNTIELNIHRIPNLSENFVLFNDDMIINDKTDKSDFFQDGLPVDSMNFSVIPTQNEFSHILLNNMLVINKHFSKKEVIRGNWRKIFNIKNLSFFLRNILTLPWPGINGFYNQHQGIPYTKSAFEHLWSIEKKTFSETCTHKIRSTEDVSDWLIRYYQLCTGLFVPGASNNAAFFTVDEVNQLKRELTGKKHHKFICINDVDDESSYSVRDTIEVQEYLETRFPNRSNYERT
ncbi:Stealth CR1 domain-containing protein [Lactiplantibacillus plantarum]|uniref:Stealth CR1 domain-containing protein n=1 Tax=Lactiplantibacillus plantarum TaxID=1590 RepID=UPI0020C0D776|nr:Stealth CR1 domain-containing protein [Lactiplantibacillus plantarum]